MDTTLITITAILAFTGMALELTTLCRQILLVYLDVDIAKTVVFKNWKLVTLYGIVALVLFPITVASVVLNMRQQWEDKLYRSIKNNLYIRERV